MKIQTHIRPRSDGTVVFRRGNQKIVFSPDESGFPCAEVDDEAAIVALLSAGDLFEPVDERDFARAEQLLTPAGEDDDDDEDDALPDDIAPPIEAQTPPKRRPGRPRKAA